MILILTYSNPYPGHCGLCHVLPEGWCQWCNSSSSPDSAWHSWISRWRESKAALSSDSNTVPRICHFSRVTESVQEPGICTLPNMHKLDIFFCQCRMINIFKFEIPVWNSVAKAIDASMHDETIKIPLVCLRSESQLSLIGIFKIIPWEDEQVYPKFIHPVYLESHWTNYSQLSPNLSTQSQWTDLGFHTSIRAKVWQAGGRPTSDGGLDHNIWIHVFRWHRVEPRTLGLHHVCKWRPVSLKFGAGNTKEICFTLCYGLNCFGTLFSLKVHGLVVSKPSNRSRVGQGQVSLLWSWLHAPNLIIVIQQQLTSWNPSTRFWINAGLSHAMFFGSTIMVWTFLIW